jgi:hypothetical protein
MLKTYNYSKMRLLHDYEYINIYRPNNLNTMPKIKKVLIKVSFRELIKNLGFDFESEDYEEDDDLKTKIFIAFFLFFSNTPFISQRNIEKKISRRKKIIIEDFNFSLTLNNKRLIDEFLVHTHSEAGVKSINDNKDFYYASKRMLRYELFTIKTSLPLGYYYGLSYILDSSLVSINVKDVDLPLSFLIENRRYTKPYNNVLLGYSTINLYLLGLLI